MNKINRPAHDDLAALDALANNRLAGSYPYLQSHIADLKAGYAQYIAVNGDASAVKPVQLPDSIAAYLRGHYANPPKVLAHITEMRTLSDANTCPMCGSLHSGTLDHVMDKDEHPAFSIFAQNLVPACKCNSKRLKPLVGLRPGERILHPYFDDVLSERIVAAHFTDLGIIPRVETRIVLDPLSPFYAAACFHHDNVVMRTAIHGYLRTLWSKLIRRPSLTIPELKHNPASRAELIKLIEDERDRNDELRDSKNNWDSIFLSGLLDRPVIDWLFTRIGQVSNLPRP